MWWLEQADDEIKPVKYTVNCIITGITLNSKNRFNINVKVLEDAKQFEKGDRFCFHLDPTLSSLVSASFRVNAQEISILDLHNQFRKCIQNKTPVEIVYLDYYNRRILSLVEKTKEATEPAVKVTGIEPTIDYNFSLDALCKKQRQDIYHYKQQLKIKENNCYQLILEVERLNKEIKKLQTEYYKVINDKLLKEQK